MGYIIQIGNAIPLVDEDSDILEWQIEDFCHKECPIFFGDSSKENYREPSYSVWDDFCEAVGLEDMFYRHLPDGRTTAKGFIYLADKHLELVSRRLIEYKGKMKTTIPPGYQEIHERSYLSIPEYDGYLARLTWLEFWTKWAISNCETPALSIL